MLSKKKKVGLDYEVLKMLKCIVRLYIDKLFQLMLNPGILMLILKILEQQIKYRVWANDYIEVVNLEQ